MTTYLVRAEGLRCLARPSTSCPVRFLINVRVQMHVGMMSERVPHPPTFLSPAHLRARDYMKSGTRSSMRGIETSKGAPLASSMLPGTNLKEPIREPRGPGM